MKEAKKNVIGNSVLKIELSNKILKNSNPSSSSSSSSSSSPLDQVEGSDLRKRDREEFETESTFVVDDTTNFLPFGTEIVFSLTSSVTECPEYLVNKRILEEFVLHPFSSSQCCFLLDVVVSNLVF